MARGRGRLPGLGSWVLLAAGWAATAQAAPVQALPDARQAGSVSVEQAQAKRHSLRHFGATPLGAAEVGQLLWAAQGLRSAGPGQPARRTTPSAGALYPLVLYLVAGQVDGIDSGVHRYEPDGHGLSPLAGGDARAAVAAAARGQHWMAQAPAMVVIAARPARTALRYGDLADRFVAIEAGAAAQNLLLQAVALGLGGTLVGAIDEAALRRSLPLPDDEQPLVIVPIGRAP